MHFGCTTVTLADVEARRLRMSETSMGEGHASLVDARQTLIEYLLAERLASSVDVVVTDADVDEVIAGLLRETQMTLPALEQRAIGTGTTLAHYRDELRLHLLIDRVGSAILEPPTDAMIDAEAVRQTGADADAARRAAYFTLFTRAIHEAYSSRARQWAAVAVDRSGPVCVER